jgi:lactate racemase
MNIRLAYGKFGLEIDLPDRWKAVVIEPRYIPGLPNPVDSLKQALRYPIDASPLRDIVKPGDKVGLIFSDISRPTPNHLILPVISEELNHISRGDITLFNSLGTHRPNTKDELCGMLGGEIVSTFRIVQNNAFDQSTQVHLGTTMRGLDIWINREIAECDVKILTGFIEPHFFAGFSGGGKALMPGMGGLQTILGNHDAQNIGNPCSTWGITHGNPIWEEIHEIAALFHNVFLINVTLNKNKEITGVFAGNLQSAHAEGCEFVKETAMVPVPHAFDIVITTNSGYPLDLNLYQSVKGMSAACQIVRQGGSIIIAAECWDGIPEHGLYGKLLREASTPRELFDRIYSPGFLEQDQWQAQIQAKIQLQADVFIYSDHLTDSQICSALLSPCRSITDKVEELIQKYGNDASICFLPEGPQTIPYIQS